MATTSLSIPNQFQPALAALLTSFDYAQDSGADAWQFAIDLPELLATGSTLADLRWLIHRGFAEHAKETTIAGDSTRSFRPLARTTFPDDACVVLTAEGASAIRALLSAEADPPPLRKGGQGGARGFLITSPSQTTADGRAARGPDSQLAAPNYPPLSKGGQGGSRGKVTTLKSSTPALPQTANGVVSHPAATAPLKPHYDAMLQELRLGDEVVKCFTRPAPAQELILKVFEEEGWPPAIDDPLTSPNQDPKRHLHYTVRNLNRGQEPLRIRFYINGHGETIRWEIIPDQRASGARSARQRR